ncbi:hypothetical protein GCK32_008625 [Trichostrongylus colubriformis]|uniref:Uncharacterized protein n=2 Tax=Trichostrongylus colubriformis TaxID=6319 RepID=A0AAN8FHB3_TRICO
MKAKFSACAAQFCFDTLNPEEMFSCLAKFLTAFCDAQQQLWTENEQREQVKRQTIARSYFAKKGTFLWLKEAQTGLAPIQGLFIFDDT